MLEATKCWLGPSPNYEYSMDLVAIFFRVILLFTIFASFENSSRFMILRPFLIMISTLSPKICQLTSSGIESNLELF